MEKKKKKEDLTEMENLLEEVRPGQGLETILEQINLFKRAWEDHTNALREQRRLRREEQARREREARENFFERGKWLVGKWNTPEGVLFFVDTEINSAEDSCRERYDSTS